MQSAPHLLTQQSIQLMLPKRAVDAHKGKSGSVAIIGGDDGMVGAVLLAARSALFSGAGRVYSAMLSKSAPSVDFLHPEMMMRTTDAVSKLAQLDAVAIGPGLGQSDEAVTCLSYWLKQDSPLVLDADALNLIANHADLAELLKNKRGETVITPHPGEAARLLDVSAAVVQSQRTETALALAKSLHVICVLKGASTVIAEPDGSYSINTTGNAGLATGGTGDVLTGIIASFIAQGVSPNEAAKLGAYLHGKAADDLVALGVGPIGLTASELAPKVRGIINQLNIN